VHDLAHRTGNGEWLYPPERISSVLYLSRHPFDVAVSFAHHMGLAVDDAIEIMASDGIASRQHRRLAQALPQRLGTWSGNVMSWLGGTPYRVSLARYEDIHAEPEAEFERLAAAAGIVAPRAEIARVVQASRFERLRDTEQESGFRERPASSTSFFRSGKPRSWEGKLDEAQRQRIVAAHGEVMERLGYRADGSTAPLPDAFRARRPAKAQSAA
jgi:hypothetical protein